MDANQAGSATGASVTAPAVDVVAVWQTYGPAHFGADYPALRAALVSRDADTVVRLLDAHGELDLLLPVIEELELVERMAVPVDEQPVSFTEKYGQKYGVTEDDVARAADQYAAAPL